MHPEDPALTSPCTPSSPGLAAQEGTRVPHPTSDACSHTHSARKTTGEAEVLNGRKTAGEMKTNSLSSFVPTVHSKKKKKKEQAALLKEKKKYPITQKAITSYPAGWTAAHPLLSLPVDYKSRGMRGCSGQRAQATKAESALIEGEFPSPVTPRWVWHPPPRRAAELPR